MWEKKIILSGTVLNKSGRRAPDEVSKALVIDLLDIHIRKTGKMKDKYYLEEKVTLKKP